MDSVTWYQAVEYCNKRSIAKGLTPVYNISDHVVTWDQRADGYRLLTEAEWEYAARAGSHTVFNAGDQITSNNANFQGNYPYLIEENYVSRKNPVGALTDSLRVNRGGGFNDFAKHLRSAYRSASNPIDGDQNMGFRVGRNAETGEGIVETTYSLDIKMPEDPLILIAYFSYSGNTKNGVRIIQEKTGADMVEMETPYRGNIYEVSQADLNQNIRSKLTTHVENMEEYDVVLLGYPTWWATMPMPVVSFVEQYDFGGRRILLLLSILLEIRI